MLVMPLLEGLTLCKVQGNGLVQGRALPKIQIWHKFQTDQAIYQKMKIVLKTEDPSKNGTLPSPKASQG